MPADRISPGSSLLETMRALAQSKPSTASSAPAHAAPADGHAAPPPPAHSVAQLRQRLASLLANVHSDDETSVNAAREPVLREIILWEFGSDFRQSAHFQPMIERINQAMDTDARFHTQFVDMIKYLKR